MGQWNPKEVEAHYQPKLDKWYREIGWRPFARRKHNTRWDLKQWRNGSVVLVEEKIRPSKRPWPDILVELWEGMPEGHFGWLKYTEADRLIVAMCQEYQLAILYDIDWRKFRPWVVEWMVRTKRGAWVCTDIGDQGPTISVLVPVKDIPRDLYALYLRA